MTTESTTNKERFIFSPLKFNLHTQAFIFDDNAIYHILQGWKVKNSDSQYGLIHPQYHPGLDSS